MTDAELLSVLRARLSKKLFAGTLTIEECGKAFEHASANTSGVGIACFAGHSQQERAFNEAFKMEAVAARPYIYALEKELVRVLASKQPVSS